MKETIQNVEDVSALKRLEFDLGKVHESINEAIGGHAEKKVAVEVETRSHKPGVSLSGDARMGKAKVLENIYTVPDDIFAEYEYKP